MRQWIALGLLAVLVAGCVTPPAHREESYPSRNGRQPGTPPVQPIPPVMPTPSTPVQPTPITPEPAPLPSYPRSAEAISGQAVVGLMKQARQERDQNQNEQAAATLERAMRIEPRNYFVWSMLAQVYLDQQNYDQAIAVAGKSNSLARGNVYVELENWKTIAAARSAQGDSLGALQAQAKVEELQRTIGG